MSHSGARLERRCLWRRRNTGGPEASAGSAPGWEGIDLADRQSQFHRWGSLRSALRKYDSRLGAGEEKEETSELGWFGGDGSSVGTGGGKTRAVGMESARDFCGKGRRVGKYFLREILGTGTFGVVRRAMEANTGREYAIKVVEKRVIRENMWVAKIRREVKVMKELRHPCVVALKEVMSSPSRIYIVMELVRGGELYWMLHRRGALPENEARRYFQYLVDGVLYCHRKGVFHRDLKPENLLICPETSALKVTDFGLSAISAEVGDGLMKTACGSPHYVAPEMRQAGGYKGEKVDAWSCGIILYLLLTGWLPFDDEDPSSLVNQIRYSPVDYPEEMSEGARNLIEGLLTKDPRGRLDLHQVTKHPWFRIDYHPVNAEDVLPRTTMSAFGYRASTEPDLRKQAGKPPFIGPEESRATDDEARSPVQRKESKLVELSRSFASLFGKIKTGEKKKASFTARFRSNALHFFRYGFAHSSVFAE